MTNFERIKQMSAKEFAEWLIAEEDKSCSEQVWCKSRYCEDVEGDCAICLTEWLNKED